jgi:ribosomal protein S6--L-glutamate ligase
MVIEGDYAGAVERRLPTAERAAGRWKHNVHRGATASGIELPDERRTLLEEAARTLDIDWLGIDLLVSDGRTVVNETNARPTVDEATKYEPGFYNRLAALIRQTAEK